LPPEAHRERVAIEETRNPTKAIIGFAHQVSNYLRKEKEEEEEEKQSKSLQTQELDEWFTRSRPDIALQDEGIDGLPSWKAWKGGNPNQVAGFGSWARCGCYCRRRADKDFVSIGGQVWDGGEGLKQSGREGGSAVSSKQLSEPKPKQLVRNVFSCGDGFQLGRKRIAGNTQEFSTFSTCSLWSSGYIRQ
jgi:hypothetical protein